MNAAQPDGARARPGDRRDSRARTRRLPPRSDRTRREPIGAALTASTRAGQLSAPAQRWDAPACRRGHLDAAQSARADRRRADFGARRLVAAGAGQNAARAARTRPGIGHRVHQPRPAAAEQCRGSHRDHVCRAQIVETASVASIVGTSRHPYTHALIGSALVPEPHVRRRRVEGIGGAPPDLRYPPPGCRFHPRCPRRMDICAREQPANISVDGTTLACWWAEQEFQNAPLEVAHA